MNEEEKKDMKYCLDRLLNIAECYYTKYSQDDTIAEILDIYTIYFG